MNNTIQSWISTAVAFLALCLTLFQLIRDSLRSRVKLSADLVEFYTVYYEDEKKAYIGLRLTLKNISHRGVTITNARLSCKDVEWLTAIVDSKPFLYRTAEKSAAYSSQFPFDLPARGAKRIFLLFPVRKEQFQLLAHLPRVDTPWGHRPIRTNPSIRSQEAMLDGGTWPVLLEISTIRRVVSLSLSAEVCDVKKLW